MFLENKPVSMCSDCTKSINSLQQVLSWSCFNKRHKNESLGKMKTFFCEVNLNLPQIICDIRNKANILPLVVKSDITSKYLTDLYRWKIKHSQSNFCLDIKQQPLRL